MKTKPKKAMLTTASPFDLTDALDFDPFDGDFGDGNDRSLRDKIVKTRKRSKCSHCAELIAVNQLTRARTDVIEGSMMSWRWCQTCTELMALTFSKDDDTRESAQNAYEARCK